MTGFEEDIEHCVSVLRQGGLILYPTDTVWGIGCDATNAEAVQKIYRLKERELSKAMIILVADEKDILQYVANPDPRVFEFLKTTVKPTTIIYEGPLGIADNLTAEDGTIAIRIVKDKFCRHLIKRFRHPIVSTSANIAGDPAPATFREVLPHIRTGVDYVVKFRRDDLAAVGASSLVKWNTNGSPIFLRH